MDAARWIIPQQVADLSEVTLFKILRLLWTYPAFQAMFWFRVGSWFRQRRIPLSWLVYRILFHGYGLEISIGADYDGGLYIPHPFGSVIAARKIGENCSIISNVTLGMRNKWEFPELGDRVFVGSGARILGGIHVGDDAVVGANAVVIQDIPDGATVVGIPAKIQRIYGRRVSTSAEVESDHEIQQGDTHE